MQNPSFEQIVEKLRNSMVFRILEGFDEEHITEIAKRI